MTLSQLGPYLLRTLSSPSLKGFFSSTFTSVRIQYLTIQESIQSAGMWQIEEEQRKNTYMGNPYSDEGSYVGLTSTASS